MTSRLRLLGAAAVLLTGVMLFGSATPAEAAGINTAIRGSSDTVYWYATNGKRYVFPDAQTYLSWFPNFTNVVRVSDYELTTIPLGGNVTYRPGARLVKIDSDPKVYAVSRYGVLRWVTGESLASQLYGYNWMNQVRDIPTSFFTNYTIGSAIWTSSDYTVSTEYNSVGNPSDNLGVSGSVLGTSTNGGFTSTTYLTGGVTSRSTSGNIETVTFTANVYNPNTDYGNIRIELVDSSNNSILRSCTGTNYCSVSVASSINTTRTFAARAYDQANRQVTASPIVVNYGGGTTSANATMTADRTAITSGESVTLSFSINNVSVSPSRIEIRDTRTNGVVRSCFSSTSCTVTIPVFSTNNIVGEVVQFSAIAYDSSNAAIASANAPLITIGTVVGTTGSVLVNADRTTVNGGESISFTANAQNVNGPISNLTMRLYDERNGNLLNTCYGTTTCQTWVTTTTGSQYTFRVYADVSNANGQTFSRGFSQTVLVNSSTTSGNVTVSADRTSVNTGESVLFTVNVSNLTGSVSGMTIRLYDERNGNLVQTCNATTSCQAWVATTGGSYTFRVYSDVSTSNGQSFARAYSPIVSVNTTGGCTQNCGGTFTGTLTLSADRTTVRIGERINLTSTLSGLNVGYDQVTIRYFDSRTGSQVAECRTAGANCFPNPLITGNTGTMQFSAIATDMQGRTLPTALTQTITVQP